MKRLVTQARSEEQRNVFEWLAYGVDAEVYLLYSTPNGSDFLATGSR